MRNKQIEKIFTSENLEEKSKFISNLTCEHIINNLSKRDPINNKIICDLNSNYLNKFLKLFNEIKYPLGYLNDDIFNTYLFTKPHIKNIINNPHQSIIKNKELIKKERLKVIDANTDRWLASKPGKTYKEKLSNQEKILSIVKRYSYNIKENQVFVSYFKKVKNYFSDKKELIERFPDIFGDINLYQENISKINKEINKINYFIKEEFEEVVAKEYTSPNNALIGNVDYASIWKSNQFFKEDLNLDFDYNSFKNVYFKMIILSFMASTKYSFIEDFDNLFNNDEFLIYKLDKQNIYEYTFDLKDNIYIYVKKYIYKDYEYMIDDESEFEIELESLDYFDDNRGIPFKLIVNDKEKVFNIDLIGIKDSILFIGETLNFDFDFTYKDKEFDKYNFKFSSVSAYDNTLYALDGSYKPHYYIKDNEFFNIENDSLYYSNDNNIYLNSYNKVLEYSSFLRKVEEHNQYDSKTVLIYDVKDSYDSFSSKDLRSAYTTSFNKSYPVWRSILASESTIKDKNLVIDLVGNEADIVKIGTKNGLYLHKEVCEWPLYIDNFNEYQFLNTYCDLFSDKYDISLSINIIDDLIASGKLVDVIKLNKEVILVDGGYDNHDYIKIFYDNDVYDQCIVKLEQVLFELKQEFSTNKILFIIPDYINLNIKDINYVYNNELLKGAEIIEQRVLNNEICWYELLPDLSLEIIKNGYYDELKLIDNKECENIIGKDIHCSINQTFILTAGKKDYTLPLIKSFIGENNKMINAKLIDDSFPLKNDVEVNLELTYSYYSENSYNLVFTPKNKNEAPFEKVVVQWVEDDSIDNLKELPKIINTEYTKEEAEEKFEKYVNSQIAYFDRICTTYGYNFEKRFKAVKQLSLLANDIQKLMAYDLNRFEDFKKYLRKSSLVEIVNNYLKIIKPNKKKYQYENDYDLEVKGLEQTLVATTLDPNLFTDHKLEFPYCCFGRYLGFVPNDEKILNMAYSTLIEFTKQEKIISNIKLREYLDRMTSATASNYLFIQQANEYNSSFIFKLLDVIIHVMKRISNYKFRFDDKYTTRDANELCYEFRYCIELLISYLYVRDRLLFKDLRPGGKKALEIIHYIKVFNKNYQLALSKWPDQYKKPKMSTKYRMKSKDKPQELSKVFEDAYCLILYLSGAVEANNIVMNSEE